ncbi:IS110 family transposase [Ensifer sp. IC4062]|nr:IS110 family transposase [Ensifer sp. IC4062]
MIIRIGERRFGKSSRNSCQPMLRSAPAWSDFFRTLRDEWAELDRRIKAYDDELLACEDERARRLTTIPGIGVIHATALIAAIGDASAFAGGRDLAVWLGLSRAALDWWEEEDALSKRGNRYLRTLLICGARAALGRQSAIGGRNVDSSPAKPVSSNYCRRGARRRKTDRHRVDFAAPRRAYESAYA